jgi:5-methylcytosine-specific restriction endonuclease McrA
MHDYALAHLTDVALLRDLAALVARDRTTTASLLAHIAEVDARKLYVPTGYPSMFEYCVEELRLSEDAAYRRIRAARAARQFSVLFTEVAEGRLHLAAICLLAPHLTSENADEMIAAARGRKKHEIESWLAGRFPALDLREARDVVRPLATRPRLPLLMEPFHPNGAPLVPGRVEGTSESGEMELVPGRVETLADPAPERFLVQVTIGRSTHDKLRYVQELLSHAVPRGDVAQVLDRALDALIPQLERQKFGAARRKPNADPGRRLPRRSTARARYIPAAVRRAVWERDQGQCTFVGAKGVRCQAARFLEFDHIEPVARGGSATVAGIRLRCRAHNQHEAERMFGAGFMRQKRDDSRLATAQRREAHERSRDVLAGLRSLGCRAHEARRAAEFSETLHGATLEDRMRAALSFLGRRSTSGHGIR